MKKLIIYFILFCGNACTIYNNEDNQVGDIFKKHGAIGTFVLYNTKENSYSYHNYKRANKEFIPASTFKILNSLIGLSTGAVKNVDEIFFHYDGTPLYLKNWEKDMSIREAIKVSNFVAYQELARKIGLKRMAQNVEMVGYGNKNIGNVVDRFWVDGPLKISAKEEVQFLTRLAEGKLPFTQNVQKAVREITILETGKNWVLHGKTGFGNINEKLNIGWFVGWVEQNNQLYVFALNMDFIKENKNYDERLVIAKDVLKAKGLIS